MRKGFTTGSCAAAAAKAACYMLFSGQEKKDIIITTPAGIDFHAQIVSITRTPDSVSCGVVKDGGDDPDITSGLVVMARVQEAAEIPADAVGVRDEASMEEAGAKTGTLTEESGAKTETLIEESEAKTGTLMEKSGARKEALNEGIGAGGEALTKKSGAEKEDPSDHDGLPSPRILIDGGEGVGRVTKPGLDQPVGNAAINHVPREMIEKEVREVCDLFDFHGEIRVEISIPGGEETAVRTFNPRLGIKGGLSVLGTSGIVEPMSQKALLDAIRVELRQQKALDAPAAVIAPGNYGRDFMAAAFGYDLDRSVKCSNFIGDTIDRAKEVGFTELLLVGHIGKLIKVAGGITNTHSRVADCRMELLAAAAVRAGAGIETVRTLLEAVTTDEGVRILKEAGILGETMRQVMEKVMQTLRRRAGEEMRVECMIYSKEEGLLAESADAQGILQKMLEWK